MKAWLLLPALVVGVAACSSSSGKTIDIRSHNMEHTLRPGHSYDFLDATSGYRSKPGDIIEFRAPSDWAPSPGEHVELVQRVIATGGQTIRGIGANRVEVSTDRGRTYRTLDEPYVFRDSADDAAHFGPVTIPAGRLWVMGDHRNDSSDSRFHCSPSAKLPDPTTACDPTESTVPASSVTAYRRA